MGEPADLQDTPQNRMVNLLVNVYRMTHRNAWNLLRFLAKSEDFIVGFGNPETMLRAWEKAGRVEWQIATDRRGNLQGGVWRIVPDAERGDADTGRDGQ